MKKISHIEQFEIISKRIESYKWYGSNKEFTKKLEKAFKHFKDHCDNIELTQDEFEVSFLIALEQVS